jgi:serine/threonine-protein kinase
MEDALIGRVIASKFAIEALIGSGAMGVVYRARHLALDKAIAVKVLHESLSKNATYAARLRREAKAASLLDHPNSVRIVDFGEEPDGLLYIAMELLDGLDLLQVLDRDWPLPDRRIIDLLCQTLSGLAVAHDLGIIHRDLKPENIMIVSLVDDEGRPRELVKVCDFGIAKIADASDDHQRRAGGPAITMQNTIIGTPEYMSPEQCRGEPTDARSDIYSVGVVLYQLLAGHVPFQAVHALDLLVKHLTDEPPPPSQIREGVPRALEEVCLKALRKRPAERYATAREMRAELRAAGDRLETPTLVSASGLRPPFDASGAETLSSVGIPRLASEPPAPTALDAVNGRPASQGASARAKARSRLRRAAQLGVPLVFLGAAAIVRPWKAPAAGPPVTVSGLAARATPTAIAETPQTPPVSTLFSTASDESRELMTPVHRAAAAATGDPHRARNPAGSSTAISASPPGPATPAPSAPPPVVIATPAPAAPASTRSLEVVPLPATPAHTDSAVRPDLAPVSGLAIEPARATVRRGRLSWSVTAAGGGATTGAVAHALARAGVAWQRCYDAALSAHTATSDASGTMRLTCDDQGRVINATVSGVDMGDVASCIRASTAGVTIPSADTGEAWASVALTFKALE